VLIVGYNIGAIARYIIVYTYEFENAGRYGYDDLA
jgi:hypothetical protein